MYLQMGAGVDPSNAQLTQEERLAQGQIVLKKLVEDSWRFYRIAEELEQGQIGDALVQ